MSITLIDSRSTALTVTWPATEGALRYILEYRSTETEDFTLLSEKLGQTQARKKNLTPSHHYFFRVAAVVNVTIGSWMTHAEAFITLSNEMEETSMAAPKVTHAGSNQALLISWTKTEEAAGYELAMRENEG